MGGIHHGESRDKSIFEHCAVQPMEDFNGLLLKEKKVAPNLQTNLSLDENQGTTGRWWQGRVIQDCFSVSSAIQGLKRRKEGSFSGSTLEKLQTSWHSRLRNNHVINIDRFCSPGTKAGVGLEG